MKIIESDDEVLKVYYDDEDDSICLEFESGGIHKFTPLESMELRDILTKLLSKCEYFRGLRKHETTSGNGFISC